MNRSVYPPYLLSTGGRSWLDEVESPSTNGEFTCVSVLFGAPTTYPTTPQRTFIF